MADETKAPTGAEKAVTTQAVKQDDAANTKTRAAQAEYEGNHHMDKVEVTIIKDGDYYKKGEKDTVHPTVAAIMKEKGLIGDYKKDIKPYAAPKVVDGKIEHNA